MSEHRWSVPIEAVRGMADTDGGIRLAQLIADGVRFGADVALELDSGSFFATLTYRTKGVPSASGLVRVRLIWKVSENAQRPEVLA